MRWMILLSAALLLTAESSRAEERFSLRPAPSSTPYYGPYSVYGPGLTYRQPSFYYGPLRLSSFAVQTSVSVPDGGSALVGGYSSFREGRNEFGSPVLGKTPIGSRLGGNRGYGRTVTSQRISVGVRIISLAEEEARQTGVK